MAERSLKKYIIITSIFNPTEAIEKFALLKDYQLVVVGDRKTPPDWTYPNCIYLGMSDQAALAQDLSNVIPLNHYGRKMLGYIYATRQGADIIIDTDDDNIPYDHWDFPSFEGDFQSTSDDLGWINIYKHFSDQVIWPRGLPLRCITETHNPLKWNENYAFQKVAVWQGLADEDPDVDAIYRLTSNKPCIFKKNVPLVLEKGTVTPFNSQNTAFQKKFFPLLFLPSFVTFRFTDILRSIIAQPIIWQQGYRLGFTQATVIQKRNEHDYLKDFESEVPMYLHTEKAFTAVLGSISSTDTISDSLYNGYQSLLKIGVVEQNEISVLEEWLKLF